jgi:hypothetical protein
MADPLVGRVPQMALLADLERQVEAQGRPGAVLIVGPPGLGKSRLLAGARLEAHRANDPIERILEARPRTRHFIVTTPRGRLLGVLSRTAAEGAHAPSRSRTEGGD